MVGNREWTRVATNLRMTKLWLNNTQSRMVPDHVCLYSSKTKKYQKQEFV
jgi:hypothetical protein